MKFEIRAKDLGATLSMRDHIYRRFDFALSRYRNRVRSVTIRLEDVNGPKGGEDKRLHALLKLDRGRPLSIEDRGADFYHLVDGVAGRLGRVVSRLIDRQNVVNRRVRGWAT